MLKERQERLGCFGVGDEAVSFEYSLSNKEYPMMKSEWRGCFVGTELSGRRRGFEGGGN